MIKSERERAAEEEEAMRNAESEFKTLLEQEKDRRVKELPKFRPADQIDISEK